MAYFIPGHRGLLIKGSTIAEHIVCRETDWNVKNCYDVKTLAELSDDEKEQGVFAKLLFVDAADSARTPHYRICLQDSEIFSFIKSNSDIDMLSFITFIMIHELLHIHRFSTGKADYFTCDQHEEEVCVDSLTRLFLTKHPVTGLKNIITLLDKVEAAPLYKFEIVKDQGRIAYAHL